MLDSFTIAFYFPPAELNFGDRFYQKTVASYLDLCGGGFHGIPYPAALVKLPEHQTDILPPIIDALYDSNVRPIVGTAGFDAMVFPQQERSKDLLKLLSSRDMAFHQYTLLVGGGWIVKTNEWVNCLTAGVNLLQGNPDVLSVAFESAAAQGQQVEKFIACPSLTSRPVIVRTRDLMFAAKMAVDNAAQLQAYSSEQAISHMMGLFSYSAFKHLAFNPAIAYSL